MTYCCKTLKDQVGHECLEHPDPSDCPDALIVEAPDTGEFGIRVHDGGSSFIKIDFCPWCGAALSRPEPRDVVPQSTTIGREPLLAPNDSTSRTLRTMIDLIGHLNALPAECREYRYSYDGFGSWMATLRYKGVALRIVCDPREGEVVIERSASRKPPYAWDAVVRIAGNDVAGAVIIQAIQQAAG